MGIDTTMEHHLRTLPLFATLAFLTAGAASAQTASPVNQAAPSQATGQVNTAVNPAGNEASSVNASGTIQTVPMQELAAGANSFTEGQARARIESAGFTHVTGLAKDAGGVWRGHGDKEGRTFDVGFDYKGQLAFR
ncbi:MAG: hypothetical protein ACRYG8_23630 [Janthinobacterium lividum]